MRILTSFCLSWTLTKEILDLPLCVMMMMDLTSFIGRYWLDLCMKITSHIYMWGLPTLHLIHQVVPHLPTLHSSLMENLNLHCLLLSTSHPCFPIPLGIDEDNHRLTIQAFLPSPQRCGWLVNQS
jgi:hypothetical protein